MNSTVYYAISAVLVIGILLGIKLMSQVKTAVKGNALSALCTAFAVLLTLYYYGILGDIALWIWVAIGLICGLILAQRVKMIDMPQMVALLNGFGGAASALVALVSMLDGYEMDRFSLTTAGIALAVGMLTLTGSLVAAGKLHKLLPQKPVILKYHNAWNGVSLIATVTAIAAIAVTNFGDPSLKLYAAVCFFASSLFGIFFAIRVGGADMPITISLLNSFSGVAGSIAGMSIGDPLLVAVGGVVGASGLLLTQIMCHSMNRSLMDILMSKSAVIKKIVPPTDVSELANKAAEPVNIKETAIEQTPSDILRDAKKVVIIPGYGMALAQAQNLVKQLSDKLETNGTEVLYGIHPVAGRMPGHMNVLLAEADLPYEKMLEMDVVNPLLENCDVAIIIGANDVVNPAANTAEGTPIYGMPILNADKANHIIICNFDLKPGYAGVENPLYAKEGVTLLLGDAKQSITTLIDGLNKPAVVEQNHKDTPTQNMGDILSDAKKVIIIPGYGMALAQAQNLVKQLSDKLESKDTEVLFGIHPVAGRMPGHMNVLLAEADLPYEKMLEMDVANPQLENCDVAIIIGANDVVNPAANTAEGTPIYGMPILNVDKAKHIIICNFDLKPGYAGVDNPLYVKEGVTLMLGDAKQSLTTLLNSLNEPTTSVAQNTKEIDPSEKASLILKHAKKIVIIPGYGMALAQAQNLVKQLSDKLELKGTEVLFGIHPVAGRMPGHMNVLLAEADLPYEKMLEMDVVNPQLENCDAAIIIGANDVVNPAANTAEGTPIYGMPILNADKAKHVIICNCDLQPGYAGVENPLYTNQDKTILLLGDAKQTLYNLLNWL